MREASEGSGFTADEFQVCSELVLDAWRCGLDRDWSLPAGTLEWTCLRTAEHTVDAVFSYALFLASRKLDGYPNFGELHALPGATAVDMVDGLRAVTTLLWSTVVTAPPDARATIWRRPGPESGTPNDFAARGAHEMLLHAHDVSTGLGIAFRPPEDVSVRLRDHTRDWPLGGTQRVTDDAWSDLLERSGRPRVA